MPQSRPFFRRAVETLRSRALKLMAPVAAGAVLATLAPFAAAAAPAFSGLDPISYTEGAGPVPIAPNAVITESGSFADGYIQFSVAGATATETLALPTVASPDPTANAVSVVGSAVYVGLGGTYKQIGTVDPTNNGQAGRPLRVNFSAVLPNADFSGPVTGGATTATPDGWTINRNFIDLGSLADKSQGRAVSKSGSGPYTITGPGYSFTTDANYDPASRSQWGYESKQRGATGTFNSSVGAYSTHDRALRLYFDGNCPGPNDTSFCSAFGPDAWSTAFPAKAGDSLAFDWAAANGSDNYEVYGFIVNVDTNVATQLMYGRGNLQPWRTTSGTIPADGTYRFRFVAGSYDMTGGYAIGASLYIDDVRVLSNDASAAVAQAVMRMVTYDNSSDNPPTTRSITVETATAGGTPTSGTVPTEVTLVDDPPSIATIAPIVLTNTIADDTFAPITGTIPATDPEGDAITYGISGGAVASITVGGHTYDRSATGTYGTLYVNSVTGAYVFVPNEAAVNARLTGDSESFTVVATANGLSGQQTLTISVSVPASVPGAPTGLTAVPGDGTIDLQWTAPVWLGGSSITGYRVETSTDGGNTWTVAIANTGSAATTAQLTGLANGRKVLARVSAINVTGRGAASNTAAATPVTVPGAPSAVAADPDDAAATVTWTAPADDGGTPVTGYRIEISVDGGVTWTVAVDDTGSTATAAVVTGLANGTATTFRVSARNAVGVGAAAASTETTPRTVPGAPTRLRVSPGVGVATVAWDAPADNGGAEITGYRIEASSDGVNWTVTVADTGSASRAHLLTGLANGTPVHVRVAAINEAGSGVPSAGASATPRTVPGAPTIRSITPHNRSLSIAFDPPADNGGAEVTNYEYSLDGGVTWTAASPATTKGPLVVNRLENGTSYDIRLRAVNAAGSGPAAVAHADAVATTPVIAPVIPEGQTEPDLPHGGSKLLIDGVEQEVVAVDASAIAGAGAPAGTLRLAGGGLTVDLRGVDERGEPLKLDTRGRLVVVANSFAEVSGRGFKPGSTVDVWLFSTPYLLGNVTVGVDGTFSAQLPIPADIAVGDHTVQLNGVGADGATRTLMTAVVVQGSAEQAPALAFTGNDVVVLLTWAANLALLGLAFLEWGRRRGRRHNAV